MLGDEFLGDRDPRCHTRPGGHDLGPERPRGLDFDLGGVVRNHHHRGHVQEGRRIGDRLGVVPARMRHHAPPRHAR